MQLLISRILAGIGVGILLFACIPYLLWTHRPGFSVARRTVFTFGLYSMVTMGILLLVQLWVGWRVVPILLMPAILFIPLFTLGEWARHRRRLSEIPAYEKRAEQARRDGNLPVAQMYEKIAQMTREYYGASSIDHRGAK